MSDPRADFATRIASGPPGIAFYYGAQDPAPLLNDFRIAVVDPGHAHAPDHARPGPQWLAYISLGEALSCAPYFDAMPSTWRIDRNCDWGAWIIDQTPPEWPDFLVEQIARPIWQKGYRGFFLDTVDSYALLDPNRHAAAPQRAGLMRAIYKLREAFPHSAIILNRGFELLPDLHPLIDAIAFESLYRGWDQANQRYRAVSVQDRTWLLTQTAQAKSYGLPVIAIDYCAPDTPALAQDTLDHIRRHGIVPFVADHGLQRVYRPRPASPAHKRAWRA